MGDGSGRRSGHGSGRLSGHRNGRLSGDGSSRGSRRLVGGSQRLRVCALFPHIAMTFFKIRSTLRCRTTLKRGTGKMHFALQCHCESMFALGCHVGLVDKFEENAANMLLAFIYLQIKHYSPFLSK